MTGSREEKQVPGLWEWGGGRDGQRGPTREGESLPLPQARVCDGVSEGWASWRSLSAGSAGAPRAGVGASLR